VKQRFFLKSIQRAQGASRTGLTGLTGHRTERIERIERVLENGQSKADLLGHVVAKEVDFIHGQKRTFLEQIR
jgi:hypothetical protein